MSDLIEQLMAYEQGDLSENETLNLFQELVDTGLAWSLQGSYGRTAAALIKADLVLASDEVSAAFLKED